MSISLVTGYAGEPHVTAGQVASFNKATFGYNDQGRIFAKGNAFQAELIDANTCRIYGGDMIMQGRHIHMDDTDYEDLTIDAGATGWKRIDLIVIDYNRDPELGVETAELKVIKGTAVTGEPSTPSYVTGNIDVEYAAQFPLWRIRLDGIVPRVHSRLTPVYEPLVSKTDLFNHVYPVGSIYMSVNNVNPSTLFGGTWVAWGSGRVPVGVNASDAAFNTVEKTGGAKTHTLTAAQIPAHTHGYYRSGTSTGSTTLTIDQIPAHTHTYTKTTTATKTSSPNEDSVNVMPYDAFVASNTSFMNMLTEAFTKIKSKVSGLSFTNPTMTIPSSESRPARGHTHNVTPTGASANSGSTGGSTGHTHTISVSSTNTASTGGSEAHNILQPYITCYMWKRTA